MKDKAIQKMAEQDAYDYGFAQMFFGEGAGTKRKLIDAVINERVNTIPGYVEHLDKAYAKLSQVEMAEKALAERKKLDRMAKAGKNFRAFKSGNLNNLTTGVFLVVGGAYLLHSTGYDKKLEAEAQKLYKKAKTEIKFRRARAKGLNVEKIVG